MIDPDMDKRTLRIPRTWLILIGISVGCAVAVGMLPGGYDALQFYLRQPADNAISPAWLYLITTPFSILPWPVSWQVFSGLSVLAAGAAALTWGNKNWWVLVFSVPMLWNIWLGQIEAFQLAGLILAWLVLNRRIHPAFLGLAWLAFGTKPQVGAGMLVLITFWFWRERGWRALLPPVLTAGALVALTFALWPGWLPRWIQVVLTFVPTWWNAAIWPWGLAAWPLALLLRTSDRRQRLRMVAAATLLGSPYFALYHCTAMLALTPSPLALLLSWGIVLLGRGAPEQWMRLGWVLPAGLLLGDTALILWQSARIRSWVTAIRAGG